MKNLPDNPQITPKGLAPFKNFCMTIGEIPSSYLETMSYAEMLLWFCNYLKCTVIPAINNNAEAVKELQDLYIELKNYVDNYFTNLDVQEEINNKLDEMAEDGTLENIIADFTTIPELTNRIENLENGIIDTIMVGDSYGAGHSNGEIITGWCDLLAKYLNISANNYYKIAIGSSGFCHKGTTNQNFLEMLQSIENTITNKSDIKRIIVCGGYNDGDGSTVNQIETNVTDFIAYCNQTYPNAIVYIGMIGYNNNNNIESFTRRFNIADRVLPGYLRGTFANNINQQNKSVYLSGVENCMKDVSNFSEDHIHPNQAGYLKLAKCIYNALIQGYGYYTQNMQYSENITLINEFTNSSSFSVIRTILNNQALFNFQGSLIFSKSKNITSNSLIIGNVGCSNYILGCPSNPRYPINLKILFDDSSEIYSSSYMSINSSGQLFIYIPKTGLIKNIQILPSQCFLDTKYI